MSKKMLIETSADEVRVAIVEDGRLVDYDIEFRSRETLKGNIYKGVITNVERGLAACFVDFGVPKQGFLPIAEILPESLVGKRPKGSENAKVTDLVRRHQEVVVQVTRDGIGHKGAALTTYLSIAGRYCVLMSSADGRGGVSRKIEDEDARKKAKEALAKLNVPEGLGVIIRTAGMNRTKTELQRDLSALQRTWKGVEKAAKLGRAPTLLHREPDIVVRTIRDYLLPDINAIVVDDPEEYEEALEFFETTMPKQKQLLQLYQERTPLFAAHGIDSQIQSTWDRTVRLPSGGEIVIDQTEALVAIDVNSARSTKEKAHEDTVFKTNLEAAVEVARQLRLRDLGGIVVVDFIDHAQRKHDREVEKVFKDALKADKAKTSVGKISKNGTLELTRQRLRQSHAAAGTITCAACGGSGRVRDIAARGHELLRTLRSRASADPAGVAMVTATVDVELANHLLNSERAQLAAIEAETAVSITVLASASAAPGTVKFNDTRRTTPLNLPPAPPPPTARPAALAAVAAEAEPDDEAEDGEAAAPEARKKRRRRRRRKGGGSNGVASAEAADTAVAELLDEVEEDMAEAMHALEPEVASAPAVSDRASESEDPLEEALFGDGPLPAGFTLSFGAEADDAAPVAPASEEEGAARKKRRRRRRRKPRAEGESGGAAAAEVEPEA